MNVVINSILSLLLLWTNVVQALDASSSSPVVPPSSTSLLKTTTNNNHTRDDDGPNQSSRFGAKTTFGLDSSSAYEIIRETTGYSGWRSIIRRVVKMPNGRSVDYDLVVQKGEGAVIIFAWNTQSKTATIVREYQPGRHRIMSGLAAGIVESDKHGSDFLLAARHELEEECHLGGGTWYPLTTTGSAGRTAKHNEGCDDGDGNLANTMASSVSVLMDKYSTTEMRAYLVIDPIHVTNPMPLDDEEDIEIVEGVTINEILTMVKGGEMNLVSGWASLLAVDKLRDLKEI